MDVAIIGAGPAGLAAALRLSRDGVPVDVYEAAPVVGGLARTLDLWGERVDLGSHIFGTHHEDVTRLWLEMVGDDFRWVEGHRAVLTEFGTLEYPFSPRTLLRRLGFVESARCGASLLRARLLPRRGTGASAEEVIVARYGRRLFEALFRSYAEKLWGIPAGEVDAAFAELLVGAGTRSPRAALRAMLAARGGAVSAGGGSRFAYPNGGTGRIWERMADAVTRAGGRLHLGVRIESLAVENGRVTGLRVAGEMRRYGHVLSTMPVTQLLRAMPAVPAAVAQAAAALRFRDTVLVYLRVDGEELFPHIWQYLYPARLRAGRVTNFARWGRDPGRPDAGSSTLAVEFWCWEHDAIGRADDAALAGMAEEDLRSAGLLGSHHVTGWHVVRLRRSQPVYDVGYRGRLAVIQRWLATFEGLDTLGRHGAFTFATVAESMKMGIEAAERVQRGAGVVAQPPAAPQRP